MKLMFSEPNLKLIKASKYAEYLPFIIAQAKHETGNFKSPLYKRGNNMFGMRNASVRRQPWGYNGGSYRYYYSDSESILDFLDLLRARNMPLGMNVEQYVSFLKSKRYFEDTESNYLNGVKAWMRSAS